MTIPLRDVVISLPDLHRGLVTMVPILKAAVQVMEVRDFAYVTVCTPPGVQAHGLKELSTS